MRRWIKWLCGVLLLFGLFSGGQQVRAAQNQWVNDHAGVLSARTRQHIARVNETQFAKLPGHPRLAVEIYRHLPGGQSTAAYKVKRFEQLGIGDDDWDNGLYFVMATADHKYGLAVGYGLESALPDATASQIVTDAVKTQLRAGKYDAAVDQIVTNIATTLVNNRQAIATPADIAAKRAATKRHRALLTGAIVIPLVALVAWFGWLLTRHRRRLKNLRAAQQSADLQQLPLYRGLPKQVQNRYGDQVSVPWFGVMPAIDRQWWTHDLSAYVQAQMAALVAQLQPPMTVPLFVFGEPLALTLVAEDVVAAQNFAAVMAGVDPQVQALTAPRRRYFAAFGAWAVENGVSLVEQQAVWGEFAAHVQPADADILANAEAQKQTFTVIWQHLNTPNDPYLETAGLPLWVADYTVPPSSDDHDDFGSGDGFGGGDTGGGGFDGDW